MEVQGVVRRVEAIPLPRAAKYRGRPKVQIQAYLCAIVQNLKRLLFPLYGWLLSCCWRWKREATQAGLNKAMKQEIGQQTPA